MPALRRPFRVAALGFMILALFAQGGATAAPKKDSTAPPFWYGYTYGSSCEATDGSTCSRAQTADAATGTLDVQGSVTSPGGGSLPGQGHQFVGGYVARVVRVKQDPVSVTVSATFHVLPGTESTTPSPLSQAYNGVGVQLYRRDGSVVCNESQAEYVTGSPGVAESFQSPPDLEVTVTASTCEDEGTPVPMERGWYQAIAYVWGHAWLGCPVAGENDVCTGDTGTASTRMATNVPSISLTST
ncbi:MAG: hypothetical protein ACRDHM_07525 [Actinomycetota bacterium]